jgi:hypothetical protein
VYGSQANLTFTAGRTRDGRQHDHGRFPTDRPAALFLGANRAADRQQANAAIPQCEQPNASSHEIGHSLRLVHITAPKNKTFLMYPVIQLNNTVIPSDTLEDLIG